MILQIQLFNQNFFVLQQLEYYRDLAVSRKAELDILQEKLESNKKEAIIFNTLQMYRKDRLKYLEEIINQSKKDNFYVGIKLVRGAYLEKEIDRSKKRAN